MKVEKTVFANEEQMMYFVNNNNIKYWSFRFDEFGNVILYHEPVSK